jgi:hypothetical protein
MNTKFWLKILNERDHLGDLGIDERIRWILRKWGLD